MNFVLRRDTMGRKEGGDMVLEQNEHSAESEKTLEQMDAEFKELENSLFMKAFRGVFQDAIHKSAREHVEVNTDRVRVLYSVCERISSLLGGEAKIRMEPAALAGSVEVKVDMIDLNGKETEQFRGILDDCVTVSIVPYADGTLSFSATVSGIFKP